MTKLTVREARAQLPKLLRADAPTPIGDHWHLRALIVPIFHGYTYSNTAILRALRKAQAAANRAFRELRKTMP